jgi:hypothetical protein
MLVRKAFGKWGMLIPSSIREDTKLYGEEFDCRDMN